MKKAKINKESPQRSQYPVDYLGNLLVADQNLSFTTFLISRCGLLLKGRPANVCWLSETSAKRSHHWWWISRDDVFSLSFPRFGLVTLTREQRTGADPESSLAQWLPTPSHFMVHTQPVRSTGRKPTGSPGDHNDDSNDSFELLGTLDVVGTLHPIIPEQLPMEGG